MVSTVTAELEPRTAPEAVIRALFPCGSVTGAPKIRAMEIIGELEQSPRGVYCGAIGHFAPDGSAAFNVAIRTITLDGSKGELGIGGAVVADSTAAAEYAECVLKARYFEYGRKPLGLIETLRFESGFVRLDKHLLRMQASAAFCGLPFDREKALRALYAAVGDASDVLRVRLTLDEEGTFDCTTAPLGPPASAWTYAVSPVVQVSSDPFLRHKTTWREPYDSEQVRLSSLTGCDEVLFVNERGELTEGSRTNLFVRRGKRLLTPPLSCGLLDGVLRRELLEKGNCEEGALTLDDLRHAPEVHLGNSLRGLIAAKPVDPLS